MATASLILVLLGNQGYWFGGAEGTITLQWAAGQLGDDLQVRWELTAGTARLARSSLAWKKEAAQVTLRIQPPTVRVRTALTWSYGVFDSAQKELARGQATIHVFPDTLTEGWAKLIADRRLLVWDKAEGLPKLLAQAKAPHTAVEGAGGLQFGTADAILVGGDQIEGSTFAQSPLLGQARNGASVMIFAQSQPSSLAGYALRERSAKGRLEWRMDHPLLRGLEAADARSWLTGAATVRAVQLPPDEPAMEIAYWPAEAPGRAPAPLDALLLTKSIGKGRIVLCQIPLGDWRSDPRSQILLGSALDYLLTRPQPTPPPSQRLTDRPARPADGVPTIRISPGDKP